MSLNANELAGLVYSYIDQTGTAGPSGDLTHATDAEKTFIALAITQALQEARKLNPGLFVQRPGIVLRAPRAGTLTVTQYDTAVTLGTLTVPNDGCTVRIGGGLDNELNETSTPDTYALARPYEGATSTVNATLWHDCWVAADGTNYEAVLGDVRVGGRPLDVVNSMDDLDRYRLFRDLGVVSVARVKPAGIVQAVLCEQWASPFTKKIQTRLRFAPMPDAQTIVQASLIIAAPKITADDLAATGDDAVTFQIPQQLDETLLFPLVMNKFRIMPVFRPEPDLTVSIKEQYATAVNDLKLLRGHYAAENRIVTPGGL